MREKIRWRIKGEHNDRHQTFHEKHTNWKPVQNLNMFQRQGLAEEKVKIDYILHKYFTFFGKKL